MTEIQILILTAIAIAFIHTVSGPDHYLPFIVLAKTRRWSVAKTIGWTITCGLGHIFSSVLLGLGGAALGWSVSKIDGLENLRGGIAGWVLLFFGIGYTALGFYRLYANTSHRHFNMGSDGNMQVYAHRDGTTALPAERFKVTPWVMFLIFILGPCEPMIPLLFYPAAQNSLPAMALLISIYTACTLISMLGMVLLGYMGMSLTNSGSMERYIHVLGGITLGVCGAGMLWMGW